MLVLLITFVISGLALAGVSIPLILERIPPNGLYGFRVRKTMANPQIWYPVNKFAGKRLFWASLVLVLAAVGVYFIPNLRIDVYSYAILGIWLVAFASAIVSTVRYMNTL
jgi:hypothetical protein